jgi:phosphoribosylanthranilate isomerase
MSQRNYPEIKVCGLTQPDEAKACADLGADAIGLVFFPTSPRNVSIEQAAAIKEVLPPSVRATGIFVDPLMENLLQTVEQTGLDVIQLHGIESSKFISHLKQATDRKIIKALFSERSPGLQLAPTYDVNGFLVECGRGLLPGGNAMAWDWGAALPFGEKHPLILAGGLGPETVDEAIAAALPDAVDASSALEARPGRKDLDKVKQFIQAVKGSAGHYASSGRRLRSIFTSGSVFQIEPNEN